MGWKGRTGHLSHHVAYSAQTTDAYSAQTRGGTPPKPRRLQGAYQFAYGTPGHDAYSAAKCGWLAISESAS